MSNYFDVDYVLRVESQRHKELMKEAEQARLLKTAWLQQPCQRWTFRAASWLGTQMVEWGSRLQCTARTSIASIAGG